MTPMERRAKRARLPQSIRALFEGQPRLVLIVAGLSIAAGIFPSAFALATGALVGAVTRKTGAGFASAGGRHVVAALIAVGALLALQELLATVEGVAAPLLQARASRDMRDRALAAVQRPVGIGHLEDPALLDTLTLLLQENMKWDAGDLVSGASLIGARLVQGLAAAVLVAQFRWWAALLLAATWVAARTSAVTVVTHGLFEGLTALRRASYLKGIATRPAEAKEVRLFGLHPWLLDQYMAAWRDAVGPLWHAERSARLRAVAWLAAVTAAHALVFVAVARAATQGALTVGGVAVVMQAILAMGALGDVGSAEIWLENGLRVIPPVLELERLLAARADALAGDGAADGLPAVAIRFEDVHFRYPGRAVDTLDGLTFAIPAGRSLAIVGDNGAGKTTLVKLLARLYDPDRGAIAADDRDLRTLDPVAWRRRLSAVFQDFVRYELSAADNVGYGALGRQGDTTALERAADRAGALTLIEGLPDGWATTLSRRYAGGAELSGGQWQRVALARALFAVEAGATVLILDEPTAALDARAEADLFDRFLDLTRGLTTVLISHRFSTVRRADRIVVLEGGRVVEEGTHDALLAAGGRYARMFALQADRFGAPSTEDGGTDHE